MSEIDKNTEEIEEETDIIDVIEDEFKGIGKRIAKDVIDITKSVSLWECLHFLRTGELK